MCTVSPLAHTKPGNAATLNRVVWRVGHVFCAAEHNQLEKFYLFIFFWITALLSCCSLASYGLAHLTAAVLSGKGGQSDGNLHSSTTSYDKWKKNWISFLTFGSTFFLDLCYTLSPDLGACSFWIIPLTNKQTSKPDSKRDLSGSSNKSGSTPLLTGKRHVISARNGRWKVEHN